MITESEGHASELLGGIRILNYVRLVRNIDPKAVKLV